MGFQFCKDDKLLIFEEDDIDDKLLLICKEQ